MLFRKKLAEDCVYDEPVCMVDPELGRLQTLVYDACRKSKAGFNPLIQEFLATGSDESIGPIVRISDPGAFAETWSQKTKVIRMVSQKNETPFDETFMIANQILRYLRSRYKENSEVEIVWLAFPSNDPESGLCTDMAFDVARSKLIAILEQDLGTQIRRCFRPGRWFRRWATFNAPRELAKMTS